jgi:hypothetical protein
MRSAFCAAELRFLKPMSRRSKDPSYDQLPGEKSGIVIASALVAVLATAVILIVRGLAG